MVAARLGERLRHLVGKMHVAFDPDAEALPEVATALALLEEAIGVDLPKWRDCVKPNGRPRQMGQVLAKKIKSLRNKLAFARNKLAAQKKSNRRRGSRRGSKTGRAVSPLSSSRRLCLPRLCRVGVPSLRLGLTWLVLARSGLRGGPLRGAAVPSAQS